MTINLLEKDFIGQKNRQVSLDNALIQLCDVVKSFKSTAGEFVALNGISTNFQKGEFVSVVGKSGSGKSTMMNMITGIDHPTSGEVFVAGTNIHNLSESQRALWRGRNLGIVFQFFQLLPMLSILENVMLPMDYCRMFARAEREGRAMELLRMVDLEEHANKLPMALSTGQQQSAAVARALANDPPIIVADEPTGNLDSRSAEVILNLFERLLEQGKTILIVTHDPSITRRTSRTLLLWDGELVDETIAVCLPLLNHKQMLKATDRLKKIVYQPGATIIRQGEHNDYFFMISKGKVEIVLESRKKSKITVARLGFGEFFGDVELIHGGKTIANVRAASGKPVEVAVLHRDDFDELLAGSKITQETISEIVQQRIAENKSVSRKRRAK
jgi:ABC-type lipoprotein export system ATPase subunit